MYRSLHRSSRIFRSLLVLALLTWTALAFNAFAQPVAMMDGGAVHAAMGMRAAAATHCEGMPMGHVGSHPAPSHQTGHGCCQHGSCHCTSMCNGIIGVPWLDTAWQPLHAPVPVPVHAAPALAQNTPPLRPPIA